MTMEILTVFAKYVVVTGFGLIAARVLIYLLFSKHTMPHKPARPPLQDCAAESLKRATDLRLDANAVYDQLAGKVHRNEPRTNH